MTKNLLLSLLLTLPVHATELGDLAASLAPGGWAVLNTIGFSKELIENGGSGSILTYADSAMWDSVRKKWFYLGAPHCGGVDCQKFIEYDDVTNTWTSCDGCPEDATGETWSHAYEHNAIDVANQIWYHRNYGSERFQRFDLTTRGPWVDLQNIPLIVPQVAGALTFFQSRNEVYYLDGDRGLFVYDIAGGGWTKLSGKLDGTYSYHNFGEYNPVHDVMILGGGNGSHAFYKIAADGTVSRQTDAPISLAVTDTIISVDPVSGKYLIWNTAGQFYEYDVVADSWLQLSQGTMPVFNANSVEAPIDTYGVVMFVRYQSTSSFVWIYKHSESTGSLVAPTNLRIGN